MTSAEAEQYLRSVRRRAWAAQRTAEATWRRAAIDFKATVAVMDGFADVVDRLLHPTYCQAKARLWELLRPNGELAQARAAVRVAYGGHPPPAAVARLDAVIAAPFPARPRRPKRPTIRPPPAGAAPSGPPGSA